ncbi:MAG: nuclear transport factor 2 family protein [Acidimicrobiales bacterium]|nr:nuclear transport factor 2 family protein [Acidimicrobiales bacterium]
MNDRRYDLAELQDRAAIADLYDRQLAAAEAWDLELYDTTFTPDAEIDLRDVGQAVLRYPDYRSWLASLQPVMVAAQRITGGLRLSLEGDRATTRVPVACFVTMALDEERTLVSTGIFYNDTLERTADGWRVTRRYEELAWSR